MNEPRYGPEDPFEEEYLPGKRPKTLKPITAHEKAIVAAVGCQYFKTEAEAKAIRGLLRALNNEQPYPFGWVEHCCEVARKMRSQGKMIQMKGLMTILQNKERRQEFLEKQRETKKRKPQMYDGG